RVVLHHVLVNLGVRDSGEPTISGHVEGFGVPPPDGRQRTRQEAAHRLGIVAPVGHHRPTPTCTLRNRAGLAPWPTWPVCIGSPLPQLGTPHCTQELASAIASQPAQKVGVMPVYVGLRTSEVRRPFLMSQPTCVPNWKFSRRSSMLQDRFVSR